MRYISPCFTYLLTQCCYDRVLVFVNQPLADVLMHVERGYRMESPEGCPREVYTITVSYTHLTKI